MATQAKAAPFTRTKKLSTTTSTTASRSAVTSPQPNATITAASTLPSIEAESKQQNESATNVKDALSTSSANSSSTTTTPIKSTLATLATRFSGFEEELHLTRNRKRHEEDSRFITLQTQLTNLQSSLALESKNRAMAMKALQNWLTDRIAQWTEQIETPMTARINVLSDTIVTLTARLSALEQKQSEDRQDLPKLIDGRCKELLQELTHMKAALQAQVVYRDEREQKILNKLQDDATKFHSLIQTDKRIMDEKIREIRETSDQEVQLRLKSQEFMKLSFLEEFAQIKANLTKEREERVEGEQDLTQAIQQYATTLQAGIKTVSTQ